MKKLSAAQARIIENAKNEIDYARTHSVIEWAMKSAWGVEDVNEYNPVRLWETYRYNSREEAIDKAMQKVISYAETYGKYYEQELNGIVLCQANSRTLEALEKMGLIEIIKDGRSCIDTIKILNY